MKRRAVTELHGVTTQKTVLFSVCLYLVLLKRNEDGPCAFPFQKELLVNKRGRNTQSLSLTFLSNDASRSDVHITPEHYVTLLTSDSETL